MINLLRIIFWKSYQIEYSNAARTSQRIEFERGFTWNVITRATNQAKELTKRYNADWAIMNITKI